MKKIEIKTALHSGICKIDGGGETHTHYFWPLGPRNLIKAMEKLLEHSRSMTRGYGDVGHSGSWIEVAGVNMTREDIDDFNYDTDPSNFDPEGSVSADGKTKWCRRYIDSILDGSLITKREASADFLKKMTNAYNVGLDAGRKNQPLPTGYSGMYAVELERGYRNGQLDRDTLEVTRG